MPDFKPEREILDILDVLAADDETDDQTGVTVTRRQLETLVDDITRERHDKDATIEDLEARLDVAVETLDDLTLENACLRRQVENSMPFPQDSEHATIHVGEYLRQPNYGPSTHFIKVAGFAYDEDDQLRVLFIDDDPDNIWDGYAPEALVHTSPIPSEGD